MLIKKFSEKNDFDKYNYNKKIDLNIEKIIFYQEHLEYKERLKYLINDIREDNNKSIIVIIYLEQNILDEKNLFEKDKIIQMLLSENGIEYEKDKFWLPKQIWLYTNF